MAEHPEGLWSPEDEAELLSVVTDRDYRGVRAGRL